MDPKEIGADEWGVTYPREVTCPKCGATLRTVEGLVIRFLYITHNQYICALPAKQASGATVRGVVEESEKVRKDPTGEALKGKKACSVSGQETLWDIEVALYCTKCGALIHTAKLFATPASRIRVVEGEEVRVAVEVGG